MAHWEANGRVFATMSEMVSYLKEIPEYQRLIKSGLDIEGLLAAWPRIELAFVGVFAQKGHASIYCQFRFPAGDKVAIHDSSNPGAVVVSKHDRAAWEGYLSSVRKATPQSYGAR